MTIEYTGHRWVANGTAVEAVHGDGTRTTIARFMDDRDGVDAWAANARLAAAAPALLTACRDAADWLDRFGEHAPIVFGGEAALATALRAAIIRATGRGEETTR